MSKQSDTLSGSIACPVPYTEYEKILLSHGSGGKLTQQLIQNMFMPRFQNNILAPLHDGAIFSIGDKLRLRLIPMWSILFFSPEAILECLPSMEP
jgi:hypothetical protein